MTQIAFIGAGNIAKAILGGYFAKNPEARIIASDAMQSQLDSLPKGVATTTDNHEAVAQADVVMLCVKPNMMGEICRNLSSIAADKLFISVAAGITSSHMREWLGPAAAIVRCMPNTPALVGEGMTGLYAGDEVTEQQKMATEQLLSAVGQVSWFDNESDLDTVTAVSGSGPAYFFLLIEAMEKAAIEMGLSPERAQQLCQQTALGAAKMAFESDLDSSTLRQNVTSPGGTTAAALSVFAEKGFEEAVKQALQAAEKRSIELSTE